MSASNQSKWPDRSRTASCAKCYYPIANELTVYNNLLLRGDRIVIKQSLQQNMLVN